MEKKEIYVQGVDCFVKESEITALKVVEDKGCVSQYLLCAFLACGSKYTLGCYTDSAWAMQAATLMLKDMQENPARMMYSVPTQDAMEDMINSGKLKPFE